ncbi:MAG: DUF3987 domain-containing protein, partial [Cyanobacteriota bacterium]|nr:DUF3987 domain-containing protein [Cyanobacteriota bacterium]
MTDATFFANCHNSVEKSSARKLTREEREQTIKWLQIHSYPALPVAPAQSAYEHHKVVQSKPEQGIWQHCPLTADIKPMPLYTGKNPSYLDQDGVPHLVNHRQYQNRLPREKELKTWFANPLNGIGTLGGWHGTVWLDFDVKQFPSQIECDEQALLIAAKVRDSSSSEPFLERSHSGGWRIGIKVKQKPDFTNFALEPGGRHVGEALCEGRFTVLAPTIGPSGNPYESFNRVEPPLVDSLESIGIYSTKAKEPAYAPTQSPVRKRLPSVRGIPDTIPLEKLGNELSQQIFAGANPTGDRSEALATAIQEWYGWENWCKASRVCYSGSTAELAHSAGAALGIASDRVSRILNPVQAFIPSQCQPAALIRGGDSSCWKKIYRLDRASFSANCPAHIKDAISREFSGAMNRKAGSSSVSPSNKSQYTTYQDDGSTEKSIRFPQDTSLTDALRTQITDILKNSPSLNHSQLEASKIRLRLSYSGLLTPAEVNKLFDEVAKDLEHEELRDERRTDVDNLIKLGDQSLNLSDFLPPDLAQPLNRLSEFMSIRPEVGLTSLLVAASSLYKVGTELAINRTQGFTVPPTIFAGLVSESGQKKSPVLKAIVKKPLSVLQREKREAFQKAVADYEDKIAAWDKCKGDERSSKFPDGKPKKPQQRLYYFTNTTGEGMLYQFQAHPDKALLALVDELIGLFNSQNKYTGGRGSDRQDILSAFDGSGATLLRAEGAKADLDGLLLSIFGTIQPEVLKRLMKDCSDPDGQWARFLFVLQPLAAAVLPDEDSGGLDLTERLLTYYRRIDQLPAREYRLSREAYKRYKSVYDQLERLRVSHPNAGMRAVYSKMEGYIGRLALNLHVLWQLFSGNELPNQEIPLAIVERAIALVKFYIGQVRIIHKSSSETDLAPHIAKLIQQSKLLESIGKDGWVRDRDYQRSFNKQPRIDEARSWMKEAEALGFGTTRASGRNGLAVEYKWRCDHDSPTPPSTPKSGLVSIVSDLSVPPLTNESVENQGIQSIVSAVSVDRVFQDSAPMPQSVSSCDTATLLVEQSTPLTALTNSSNHCSVGENFVSGTTDKAVTEALTIKDDPEPDPPGGVTFVPEPPTLSELQALLLACQSLSELRRVQATHKEQAEEAYRAMSLENQLQIDGLTATRYKE